MKAALQGPSGRIILGPAQLMVGQAPDNQLVITDPKVSPRHATVNLSLQGYSITDLGSTYGTFVNEQRLGPHVPRVLYRGERVRFGDTIYTYEEGDWIATDVPPTVAANPYQQTGYGAEAPPGRPPSASAYSPMPSTAYPSAYPPSGGSFNQVAVPPPPPPPDVQPPYTPQEQRSAMPQKSGGGMKIALIVLAVLLILALGGGGFALYAFTRPQPTISVTSSYTTGATPAGSTSTVLHAVGHNFSSDSDITFLLDDNAVPGVTNAHSDAKGNMTADLTIKDSWSLGSHKLTAKDAGGYTTKTAAPVMIVAQGQAHTPGPNGAPPDDASFTIKAEVQAHDAMTGAAGKPFTATLAVKGQPDPSGGTVCEANDDGQLHSSTGTANDGSTYVLKTVETCSGTYKGGKITYVQILTTFAANYSNGRTCTWKTPLNFQELSGTFSSATTVSGTYTLNPAPYTCTDGTSETSSGAKGTWTGTVA